MGYSSSSTRSRSILRSSTRGGSVREPSPTTRRSGDEKSTRSRSMSRPSSRSGSIRRNRSRSRGMQRTQSKSRAARFEVRDAPLEVNDENFNKFVQYTSFGQLATENCRVISIDEVPEVTEKWMVVVKVKVGEYERTINE